MTGNVRTDHFWVTNLKIRRRSSRNSSDRCCNGRVKGRVVRWACIKVANVWLRVDVYGMATVSSVAVRHTRVRTGFIGVHGYTQLHTSVHPFKPVYIGVHLVKSNKSTCTFSSIASFMGSSSHFFAYIFVIQAFWNVSYVSHSFDVTVPAALCVLSIRKMAPCAVHAVLCPVARGT